MTPFAFIQVLRDWQGFYTLLGGAAATLIGLMFVATSLGTRSINDQASAEIRTFLTPTVIYFSFVLLIAALLNIPCQTPSVLGALFGAVSLVGSGYSLSHLRRLRSLHWEGSLNSRDWIWNLVLPLFSFLWMAAAAYGLERSVPSALYAAAVGILVLVMVGIRNAWDVTLYLARRAPG